jgi:hypothetical protein
MNPNADSNDSIFNSHTQGLWERAKSKQETMAKTLVKQQTEVAKAGFKAAERQRRQRSHIHNAATGERGTADMPAELATSRSTARRASSGRRSTGPLVEKGKLTRDSARALRSSARSNPSDAELKKALLTLAAKKAESMDGSSFGSGGGGGESDRPFPHPGNDTWRKIYLRSQNKDYSDAGSEDEQSVYQGQNGGDSWRDFTTARGQTARIESRVDEILQQPPNASMGKNKLFFGRAETGLSDYLDNFDGGAKMKRADFFAKHGADADPALARAAAEEVWPVVAGQVRKDPRESLMERLRSTSGLGMVEDTQQRRESENVERRQSAMQRKQARNSTVLGVNLNYPDERTDTSRREADLLNKRSLRTKRDSKSPRKLQTWEMEGVPTYKQGDARPVGQVAANQSLIWGDGNTKAKGFETLQTARENAAIIPVVDPPPPKEKPLTNQELGFFYQFKEDAKPVSEAEVRAENIKLLAASDNLRKYYNSTGKLHGGKSAAGPNDDKTRREWKGPVVWQPTEDNEPGATARRRSTNPGSARARWGVEKKIVNQQLVIKV